MSLWESMSITCVPLSNKKDLSTPIFMYLFSPILYPSYFIFLYLNETRQVAPDRILAR